ncbi:MAG: hypothetical protein FD123_283 [Bacteroidetes bacterium]|nr:MAG: hypothetical protein FD123_283 [Bacteroidota bacterium]
MKQAKLLFLPVLAGLLLSSCSTMNNIGIEKRRYNKGYHVSVRDQKKHIVATQPVAAAEQKTVAVNNTTVNHETKKESAESPALVSAQTSPGKTAVENRSWTSSRNAAASGKQATITLFKKSALQKEFRRHTVSDKTKAPSAADDLNTILLVILSFLIPPLAIYLVEETSLRFWIALICCLFSFGGIFFTAGYGLWLVAVILALLAVLGR